MTPDHWPRSFGPDLQVYRARFSGGTRLQIEADLHRVSNRLAQRARTVHDIPTRPETTLAENVKK
jgi:hypothetical protein